MARPKYKIRNSEDYRIAIRYIDQKISEYGWIGANARTHGQAAAEYENNKRGFENLNAWCERWLTKDNWAQLKNAIRAARKRNSTSSTDKPINVTLSRKAHRILSELAAHYGLTMSEYIERRLRDKWLSTPIARKFKK